MRMSRRPPLTGRQRMFRAALIGLLLMGLGSGYSLWVVHRAHVAAQTLARHHATVGMRSTWFDGPLLRWLSPRFRSKWRAFRGCAVYFSSEDGEPVSAELYEELRHLPFLESVHLSRCVFNPHDLARMASVRQLQELDLRGQGRRISDDAVDAILALRNLRTLKLSQCCLSDEGIQRLAALKTLTLLDLQYCHCLSQEAVDRLAEKLPHCQIEFEPPLVYHRYTCSRCGYATNLSEQNGSMRLCWACGGNGPIRVQKNFDICHPVLEHPAKRSQ